LTHLSSIFFPQPSAVVIRVQFDTVALSAYRANGATKCEPGIEVHIGWQPDGEDHRRNRTVVFFDIR